MSYVKAEDYLPIEVIKLIQTYVDGTTIYIPKKEDAKAVSWGAKTGTKQKLAIRDQEIYEKYLTGEKAVDLAEKYFLSVKSIHRIIKKRKSESMMS